MVKRAPNFCEVLYIGAPGNVCVVVNSDERANGAPTKGLAWGRFDKAGEFKLIVDRNEHKVLVALEYDYTEAFVARMERTWHLNTATA
tara:strand:- start:4087 stop:4350 length:264 start_codon:yes stop_codon:yes gene_type:complete